MRPYRSAVLHRGAGAGSAVLVVVLATGCTIGGVHALPPEETTHLDGDGGPAHDGGDGDALPQCTPGADMDGDSIEDCLEIIDGDDFTDEGVFNGLTAMIGDRPEFFGSCNNLDDHVEMVSHFAASTHTMDVYAGWEFDTGADAYTDPSYGFQPSWPMAAPAERFSVRYTGTLRLAESGTQCFSVDIGATGTDIFTSRNACGQVYLNAGDGAALAETGLDAASVDAKTGCVTLDAGSYPFDIVFWYESTTEQARLQVRRCTSASGPCTPDQPLAAKDLHAAD
jgi:hypothetical protein